MIDPTSSEIVIRNDGRICIEYSKPTKRWWFTPAEARLMAEQLVTAANMSDPPDNVLYFRIPGAGR